MKSEDMFSDKKLVNTYQTTTGEQKERAFAKLYRQHEPRLRWYLKRLTRDEKLANDLTQEAFLKALKGMDGFEQKSSFKTWLYRIATNTWRNYLKKHRPVSGGVEEEDRIEGTSPDEIAEQKETVKQVQEAVDSLPEKFRAPLVLVRYEDMQYSEAASTLGISTDAVRMRVHRARTKLKELLEPENL